MTASFILFYFIFLNESLISFSVKVIKRTADAFQMTIFHRVKHLETSGVSSQEQAQKKEKETSSLVGRQIPAYTVGEIRS